ncbi:MAG: HAMP domain-containing protein [Spirochaetes bacterium]|nr:HAMP domain-containing protein [Spirochaetota bacterium]
MKNWSMRTKLFFGFGIILLILAAISGLSYWSALRNKEMAAVLQYQAVRDTIDFMELQKDVLQIQLALTDVSATKDIKRYQEAENYYKQAKKALKVITSRHTEVNKALKEMLVKISRDLDTFYSIGKSVTDMYIKGISKKNREIVKVFAPYAQTVNEEIEGLITVHKGELSNYFGKMNQSFNTMNIVRLASTAGAAVIVILLSLLISASITKPVKLIVKTAEKMEKGDISQDIDFKSKDEIGTMAVSLNNFIVNLRNAVGRIQEVSDRIVEVRHDLITATEQTASASNEIAATVSSIKNQMDKLNGEISDVAGAEEEFRTAVENLDNQIANQATATEESTASIEEMIASINNVSGIVESKRNAARQLVKTAAERGEAIEKSNENIKGLLKLTDEVSSIAGIIMDISKQTNILSMNAAIEAAHAGEAGKGFAVVADEIRKLAETSNENANQISSITEKVMEGIDRTSRESGENLTAFFNINKEIDSVADALAEINANASELAAGGEQILKAMTQLNGITVSVREGADEMKLGIKQISESIRFISGVSGSVVSGITEIDTGTQDISKAIGEVNKLSKKIGDNALILDEEVKKFKV